MSELTFAGDESGDVSFSFDKGASRYFVLAAVATARPESIQHALDDARRMSRLPAGYEFRLHSLSSRPLRHRVYQALSVAEFDTWAVLVDKTQLAEPYRLLPGPNFYGFFATELIRVIPLSLRRGATLILDQFGSPTTTRANIKQTLRVREIEMGFRRIRIERSQSEPLIQVADMMAGALLRRAKGDAEVYDIVCRRFRSVVEYRGK